MFLPSTDLFRMTTTAPPGRVWEALTATGQTSGYLYGLRLCSKWQAGSTLTADVAAGPHLTGQVLRADPPQLLSYTLGDSVEEPSVYVTWAVREEEFGTVVRLYVDEPDPVTVSETEVVWLPVLAALRDRLSRPSGRQDLPEAEPGTGADR
ncbi:MAG TPA: SRPBCC domain-containing protein [Acidimicrobiales bacterium]|nr:SRPBCC domain-containing protein [Acidimicrobiales bacterium]